MIYSYENSPIILVNILFFCCLSCLSPSTISPSTKITSSSTSQLTFRVKRQQMQERAGLCSDIKAKGTKALSLGKAVHFLSFLPMTSFSSMPAISLSETSRLVYSFQSLSIEKQCLKKLFTIPWFIIQMTIPADMI